MDRVNILHLLSGSDQVTAVDAVKSLLESGQHRVDEREVEGLTPLHVACAWDNLAMCQVLLHFGADPMSKDDNGRTPVDMATGNTKRFLERLLAKESKERVGIIRRFFFCQYGLADGSDKLSRRPNFIRRSLPFLSKSKKSATVVEESTTPGRLIVSSSRDFHARVAQVQPRGPRVAPVVSVPPVAPPRPPSRSRNPSEGSDTSNMSPYETANESLEGIQEAIASMKLNDNGKEIGMLKDAELRRELVKRGVAVGPIVDRTTRKLYERRLAEAVGRQGMSNMKRRRNGREYSLALEAALTGRDMSLEGRRLDTIVRDEWKGIGAGCFCYLLLDPHGLREDSWHSLTLKEFLAAIFYIGKGTKTRPFQHLAETSQEKTSNSPRGKKSEKMEHIKAIWQRGQGVVSIQVGQNVCDDEAFTREAAMIEAIGLTNLRNEKRGEWKGVTKTWTMDDKTRFGTYLLVSALGVVHAEGFRPIYEHTLLDSKLNMRRFYNIGSPK